MGCSISIPFSSVGLFDGTGFGSVFSSHAFAVSARATLRIAAAILLVGIVDPVLIVVGDPEPLDRRWFVTRTEVDPLTSGRFGCRVFRLCVSRSEEHTSELQSPCNLVCR